MAKTNYFGTRPSAANIITGAGHLRGFLVSHDQAAVQTLTFYDNTAASGTVLLIVYIAPERNPIRIMFARADAIVFSTGLSYAAPNCEIAVWAVDLS